MKHSNLISDIFLVTRLYFKEAPARALVYFICRFITLLTGSLFSVSLVLFPKYFINAITEEGDWRRALFILGGFIALRLAITISGRITSYYETAAISDINNKIEQTILHRAARVDYENYENPEYYDMYTRAAEYARGGSDAIIAIAFEFCETAISLAATAAVIAQLNPVVVIILLLLIAVQFTVKKYSDKAANKTKDKLTRIRRRMNYLTSIYGDRDYVKDIKVTRCADFICDKFGEYYSHEREENLKLSRFRSLITLPSTFIDLIFTAVLYASLGGSLAVTTISLGDYSSAVSAALMLSSYIRLLSNNVSSFRGYHHNLECFLQFINYGNSEQNGDTVGDIERIELVDVSYRYPGKEDYALKHLTLTIESGERIAIVGRNGAGKSTLANLILGLLKPTSGKISVNGRDLADCDLDNYRQAFSVVFQNHREYAFTIAENVLMHDCATDSDREKVYESLGKVSLYDKVREFPLNVDTPLTRTLDDNGVELSGGEHQKIAIARAYANESQVLIMDEPSSSLDLISEREVYDELFSIADKKTVILISHRLSALQNADRIIVIDAGEIVESGTHDELVAAGGAYAELLGAIRG